MIKSSYTKEKIENLKKVGVILRPSTPELKSTYLYIKKLFEEKDISVQLDSISAGMIGLIGQNFDIMCSEVDLLITIGGDGTLISVARRSFEYQKPIFAISAGNLGFLTDVKIDEVEKFIEKIIAKEYRIDLRMSIEVSLYKNGTYKNIYSFNDVVMTRKSISKMINIDAYANGKLFNSYNCDGLIISTPTGSTAYNLASGGPVVYPLTSAFIVTPISAHSLTQRPLILPADFEIELKSDDEEGAIVILDGQETYELSKGDKIIVKIANNSVKLLHRVQRNYFEVLREKLSWGD
jgi:NAD+ kinase